MTETDTQTKLTERFGDKVTVTIVRPRRIFVAVARDNIKPVLQWLKDELGYYHISTVTGLDSGENFEVLYHVTAGDVEITVRSTVPKSDPHVPTVTGILPGAILYERELQDMFGLVIDDIPDPRRYVLPEDWPEGVYPLRKDYKYNAGN